MQPEVTLQGKTFPQTLDSMSLSNERGSSLRPKNSVKKPLSYEQIMISPYFAKSEFQFSQAPDLEKCRSSLRPKKSLKKPMSYE